MKTVFCLHFNIGSSVEKSVHSVTLQKSLTVRGGGGNKEKNYHNH